MRLGRVVSFAGTSGVLLVSLSWCQQLQLASHVTPPLPPHAPKRALAVTPAAAKSSAEPAAKPGAPATQPASQPESLFDAVDHRLQPVISTVEVHGVARELDTSQPSPFQAGGQEIISSAGTYGDVSRFLQLSPGVVATSDLSNEILVRGGHPMENLFLVDGIEVPNINHLAMVGTTGGFGPMIDSAMIQEVQLYTGGYDAQFPERLSSVTKIQTLDERSHSGHIEADAGIQGIGGLADSSIMGGDLLVALHQGLLEQVGNEMGIAGLPSYTNELTRYRRSNGSGNELTVLNLAGWDSDDFTPCESDAWTTTTIASQYSGRRETTGIQLQRVYSPNSFATLSISDSEQIEHIHQQDQLIHPADPTKIRIACPVPAAEYHATPVYMEDSNGAFSTASYTYTWATSRLALTAGSASWLQRPHYQIDQPAGAYSPYSVTPTRADSTSFTSYFSTGETGSFAQWTVHLFNALTLSGGGRLQTFAFGDRVTLTPRAGMLYRPNESVGFHLAYARYAQLPPYVYLLAYPGNRAMLPMRDTHEILGMDMDFVPASKIHIEAYRKPYTDIPASTEYPSVTLHDMVDMVGQQFVWLPMNSGARGASSGIELSDITQVGSRLSLRGSVAYSRAQFAGLDGVLRASNYDFPWIVNCAGVEKFERGYEIASRYGYATGRPYTPFDLPDSIVQNRPIYDVNLINAVRAPFYSRLDVQVNKDAFVHGRHLELYGGVDNVLNRSNFLAYIWMPRAETRKKNPTSIEELYQIPIFPNFGIRLIFR